MKVYFLCKFEEINPKLNSVLSMNIDDSFSVCVCVLPYLLITNNSLTTT